MGLAVTAVVLVLIVGCSSPSEPSADPSSTPQPSVPAPSSAADDDLLRDFLAARVAGEGAQQYLNVHVHDEDIPLLYATSSGAPYERAEFDRVRGIEWPYGLAAFRVRLFAGRTVVEQLFFRGRGLVYQADGLVYQQDGFATDLAPTTEDGQPVAVSYDWAGGDVTLQVARPWVSFAPGGSVIDTLGISLIPAGAPPTTDGGERNDWDALRVMADPTLFGTCWLTGPGPADAAALAESIRSAPDVEAAPPVAVRSAKGAKAVMMDVVIAAGASTRFCEHEAGGLLSLVEGNAGQSFDGTGRATGHASGERMRLYLFDAPKGSSIRVLAIAIVAPKSRFKSVVRAAAPVVDSVEFR
jgi:hypothetical protein